MAHAADANTNPDKKHCHHHRRAVRHKSPTLNPAPECTADGVAHAGNCPAPAVGAKTPTDCCFAGSIIEFGVFTCFYRCLTRR